MFSQGQPISLVYADSALKAQAAARAVRVEYKDLLVILTIDEAIAANSFFKHGKQLKKGAAIDDKMSEIWAPVIGFLKALQESAGRNTFTWCVTRH